MSRHEYTFDLTTQGPLYPPSEVMDENGNFIVIGAINDRDATGGVKTEWGGAIVAASSDVPPFGDRAPYDMVERFCPDKPLPERLASKVLHTLPLPLPCSNYPMVFAPEQFPDANSDCRPSYPFHRAPIPDFLPEHGRQLRKPVTLGQWAAARGTLNVTLEDGDRAAGFVCEFENLLPRSLYTIMTLRAHDLDPEGPTRPGPLGIPNVFVTDDSGHARFAATLPDPFPPSSRAGANRVINIVVLWMSSQMNYGGAIGRYGLGGDIHAQLKFRTPMFQNLETKA
ncbi:hypothetical protein [Notoacmeibacter marinus]|nr:hypothetical protein [Notoacmeibacter marinus]